MLTASPVPWKDHGARVAGATVNTSGVLTVAATSVGSDTGLAQIARWCPGPGRQGQGGSGWPTDFRIFVAHRHRLAAANVRRLWLLAGPGQGVDRRVAVLIVACPCALALAQVAIMAAPGAAPHWAS